MRTIAALAIVLCLAVSANAYFPATTAGCLAFAAKFDNTCNSSIQASGGWTSSTQSDWTSTYTSCDSATYSGYSSSYCPGTWNSTSSTCVNIPHKLCVSCSTVNSQVYIRIQSNHCPSRCGGGSSASYYCTWTTDWTVKFQPSVGSASSPTYVTSLTANNTVGDTATNGSLCVLSSSPLLYTKIPSNSNFTYAVDYYTAASYLKQYGTQSKTGVSAVGAGVDMAGGYLAAYTSGNNIDPLYPSPYNSAYVEGFDGTMSHPDPNGMMHYHVPSPFNMNAKALSTANGNIFAACTYVAGKGAYVTYGSTKTWCVNITGTASTASIANTANYLTTAFQAAGYNTATPLGISRDGHIIYGPYDNTGKIYTSVDACGGTFDSGGNYVYVGQTTFPYIQGCFGPVKVTGTATPACSTNARSVTSTFSYSTATFSSASGYMEMEASTEVETEAQEEAALEFLEDSE